MFRRRAALITAALLSVGLAGCSGGTVPTGRAAPSAPPSATTPAPRAPAGHAPTESFAVGVRQLKLNHDDRALPVTVWYPARGAAGGAPERSAPAATGRFPVVMFSHGLGARPEDYQLLLSRWAAAGFVVAAPRFPHTGAGGDGNVLDVLNQPADVSYVLTQVLALDAKADDPLHGRLDTERVAAAGHSAGGVTTIGLFTAGRDERLDAGIVFAGTALGVGTAFAGAAAPQLFVHGEADEVVSYASGKAVYDAVPWPKALLSLPKGDHGRALLTDGAALRVVADTTVEFLRWTLYGDAAAKRRLPADATRGGLATLDDHL
ncbi:dienelactone hydrolase family protein [Micromonospora sp. DR5-3]|uniref:alpha/beta hydrolase family protein n=1 Tax=unclassified Micromonospora TaxID=2617518 RepID=UPI0011D86158|nr:MULTISPECIES: dienelactone hydrolase family protein [unclassified Micromonospora]MCW3814847.1 dienelactone hydrolase family protein [Micromonospora sp. DR5-3]TYC24165.1 chlorophyllase [Micromonospora sp. MP36]